MPAYQDPAALRRKLQRELKRYRSEAGETQASVALAMDWSPSKVIRIENGAVAVATNDLRVLLDHYGVTDSQIVNDLITISKNSKLPSPWNHFLAAGNITQESATYFGQEASAAIIRQYEPLILPGLLQIEEYMRPILTYSARRFGVRLEAAVEARLMRQQVFERDDMPELFFIIDEAVLQRNVGGQSVMRRQLERLEELNNQDRITVQVVRFSKGPYPGLGGPFTLLEFTDDDPVLYLESQSETVTRENSDEIGEYLDIFQTMERETATRPAELSALLKTISFEP